MMVSGLTGLRVSCSNRIGLKRQEFATEEAPLNCICQLATNAVTAHTGLSISAPQLHGTLIHTSGPVCVMLGKVTLLRWDCSDSRIGTSKLHHTCVVLR